MVKHIVVWTLKESCFGPHLDSIKEEMKTTLERLNGQIEGLEYISVQTNCLSSSNADIICEVILKDENALKTFTTNPLITNATKNCVFPYTETTTRIDYVY